MQRSMRDSDEDVESKTGRKSRTLTTQSVVDSSIRRSSRIKQSVKLQKSSPDSGSDTSVNSQVVRITRQRTATMDSITTETLKGRHVRKLSSVSSEASETLDTDIGTPSKRTTRRSFITAALGTPTRASTRATSKRFVRAGSETKSPSPSLRITRRTRASSVDPETMSDQNKSTPNVSTKIRKRASVLPSQSPVKEEIEEKQQKSDIKVVTLAEVEEFTSSGKIACSKENQKVKEIDNTSKDKVEDDNSSGIDEIILAVASDEASQQLAENEIHKKHKAVTIADKKSFDKVQSSCERDLSSDVEIEIDDEINDTDVKNDTQGDKSNVIKNEECVTEIEDSLIDICKKSSTKELTVRLENIFETSIGGQKRSPSNKENQTLNIINDTPAEKNTGPLIANITSLNAKSLTTVFVNKSLNEKEIKCTRNEPSLGKRRHSRESTETAVKHTAVLRESTDSIEEITDSSTDPLNPIVIHEKKNLDSSSIDDTIKRQSLVHDVDKKSTTNDTVKPVLPMINDKELVEEIIDDHVFVETVSGTDENATKMANKLDKNVTETCNETTDSKGSSYLTDNDNSEMVLELEESNAPQDNKSLNEMKTMTESNLDHSNELIDIETCHDKSIDKLAPVTQDKTREDLLDSTEQTKNLSDHITESTPESSNTILEAINPSSSDLNTNNSIIKNTQSDDMEVSEESTTDMSPKIAESINTQLKITMISTQRENEDTSAMNIREKGTQLDQEDSENMEIDDDKSDVDIVSMFRDISTDECEKDAVETKTAIEDESNPISVENESEAECDLVLVDKRAWLAAESIKAVRDKECFEYDSDDTVLLKSKLDTEQANSNKKKLSVVNEALLINIDDDDEEEEGEEKEEGENKATKSIKTRKSSIKRKSAPKKGEDSSTICIDVDSSNSVDKFLNKSENYLNRSSSRAASRLSKSGQASDESDDEIGGDLDILNKSLQARKNPSLRKSTEKRVSLNNSSKETPLRQSLQIIQNNSASKSQADNSEEKLDNLETYTKRNLKKKMRSLDKLEKRNEDADIDEVESGSKKNSSSEESGKEDKDVLINVEDSDENDEDTQNNDLKCKKSDLNYSTLALAGSLSNNSSKLSDDTTEDSLKHCECISSLFELESDTNNDDDDGIGSINSDIKREYNLDASEQEYSDDNVPYDECRTSESESSDPDDTGSDLADFIVADDAIEGEKYEEEAKEKQNDERTEERKEVEAAEQEEVEDKDVDDEQVEDTNKNDSTHAEEDEEEKSVRTETNVSKSNAFDKSLKISKNKRKISTEHTVACQSKKKEDIKVKKSHTKKVDETNIIDTSGSTLSIKKKRKSYIDETEQDSIKQLNESEINRKKLSKMVRTPVKCSTPKIHFSKEEFANDVEIAATALEAADEKLNSRSETTQCKKKKSRKDSILKEDLSFKEPKHTNNKEKLLHSSLPSDILERMEKARPMSKMTELSKTMNVTHTETPTIRDLRKEKLNETAPELKLRTETSQLQKRRLSKKKSNIAQKETDEMDSDEEVPNLIALFNDNIQESSQRKQKKRKKQMEETSNENITESDVPQDATKSDISKQQKKKKKKGNSDEINQVLTVEDTIRKDTCQLIEKKKKKKIHVTKMNENVEDDIQQEDIRGKEKGTLYTVQDELQHSKKKKEKIVTNVECDDTLHTEYIMVAKKKSKRQEAEDSTEYSLLKESLKKKKKKEKEQEKMKKEEKIPSSQTGTLKSKLKSVTKTESEKSELQNVFLPKTVESKNTAFIKARSEALEAIKSATERIKLHKKLKKKKQQGDNANTIQEQAAVVPIKRKKTEIYFEERKQVLPSSTDGLKRLPDNVIDKLSDIPTRTKRRKLSQNTEQVMPSLSMKDSKFLETKVKNKTFIPLSSNGGTTQFAIVNMSKAKKQPSKAINSIMSYRQRMLNKNNREPVSSYLMYLQKQHTVQKSAKDGFSDNAF